MDLDAINKRKQKRLAKAIADDDEGLKNFGISKKIQKIMIEQQKRKKTRKHYKKEEEEEELLAREHKTKKRHELSTASTYVHPTVATSIPQRLKKLSEIDEEDEGFVQVVLQKRKATALVAPT